MRFGAETLAAVFADKGLCDFAFFEGWRLGVWVIVVGGSGGGL